MRTHLFPDMQLEGAEPTNSYELDGYDAYDVRTPQERAEFQPVVGRMALSDKEHEQRFARGWLRALAQARNATR